MDQLDVKLLQADTVTQNGRVYTQEVINKAYDRLKDKKYVLYGQTFVRDELQSPFDPTLHLRNVSHHVKVRVDDDGNMVGSVDVYHDTNAGEQLIEYIDEMNSGNHSVNVSFSMSGYGSIDENGYMQDYLPMSCDAFVYRENDRTIDRLQSIKDELLKDVNNNQQTQSVD